MKIVIIEDEIPAAEKLERLLNEYDTQNKVIGKAGSIKKAVEVLTDLEDDYDLVFMDIQLTDGKSFEIFNQFNVTKPVIFLTAFNQYAIEAFKVNGIDYLLKPLTYEALAQSLAKYDRLKDHFSQKSPDLTALAQALSGISEKTFKDRFLVKLGEHIRSIVTDEIAFFYADGRTAYLVTKNRDKYVVDYKLETLEDMINPHIFFRVNRTFILNISAIKDVLVYSNSRLRITPNVEFDKEIIVSREKVGAFKDWYGGA